MPTKIRKMNAGGPEFGVASDPAANLRLPIRCHNAIRNDGLVTVGDVDAYTDEQWRWTPNIGKTSVKVIRSEVARYLGRSSHATHQEPIH